MSGAQPAAAAQSAMRMHSMPFGAECLPQGGVRFRLWAPGSEQVGLELSRGGGRTRLEMQAQPGGWHELLAPEAAPGTLYRFHVQGADGAALAVPDPAARCNPSGVHGPSVVVDPRAYAWREAAWGGRPWHEAVLYELHVGAFTAQGTFAEAQRRLPSLAAAGITALQLMPLAAFAGERNWGYDGVLPYAPASSYGTPEELKGFIDAAHSLGLMVLLDVVYNHFGPDGNYLHAYCPQFFNASRRTPWGAAINFDGESSETVRAFFVHNALYWVEEYCFDGLRLDAVHAIHDGSPVHIVREIALALKAGPGRRRHVHLTIESHLNLASALERDADGTPLVATAQWDDDVHHALHVLLTGQTDGYYADFASAPLARLGRALAEGYAYQGEWSAFRAKPRGEPSAHLPPAAFVGFLQNHDMVGNRALGERIERIADPRLLDAAYVCLLLTPLVPMLFMGEEFAASTPFLYFCDFGPQLAAAVASGRRREFRRFAAFASEAAQALIPEPNAPATFAASKLKWEELDRPPHLERSALIRRLLELRRRRLVPHLAEIAHGGSYRVEGPLLRLEWQLGGGSRWRVLAHFGGHGSVSAEAAAGEVIFASGTHGEPWATQFDPGAVLVTKGPA